MRPADLTHLHLMARLWNTSPAPTTYHLTEQRGIDEQNTRPGYRDTKSLLPPNSQPYRILAKGKPQDIRCKTNAVKFFNALRLWPITER